MGAVVCDNRRSARLAASRGRVVEDKAEKIGSGQTLQSLGVCTKKFGLYLMNNEEPLKHFGAIGSHWSAFS